MHSIEQRCFNHPRREAVALCPACQHCFCRECTTEHDDKIICASCLRNVVSASDAEKRRAVFWAGALQIATGFLFVWCFFHLLGQGLMSIPSEMHEAAFWKKSFWNE